jgi:hypothetical protein
VAASAGTQAQENFSSITHPRFVTHKKKEKQMHVHDCFSRRLSQSKNLTLKKMARSPSTGQMGQMPEDSTDTAGKPKPPDSPRAQSPIGVPMEQSSTSPFGVPMKKSSNGQLPRLSPGIRHEPASDYFSMPKSPSIGQVVLYSLPLSFFRVYSPSPPAFFYFCSRGRLSPPLAAACHVVASRLLSLRRQMPKSPGAHLEDTSGWKKSLG